MTNIKQLEDICTTPDLAFTEDSFWQFYVCVCVHACRCMLPVSTFRIKAIFITEVYILKEASLLLIYRVFLCLHFRCKFHPVVQEEHRTMAG